MSEWRRLVVVLYVIDPLALGLPELDEDLRVLLPDEGHLQERRRLSRFQAYMSG